MLVDATVHVQSALRVITSVPCTEIYKCVNCENSKESLAQHQIKLIQEIGVNCEMKKYKVR